MSVLRTLVPLAAALGLILAVPAAGGAVQNGGAHANGGGVPPVIPSIVATRTARAEAALARADTLADSGQAVKVPAALAAARAQARSAWNAAVYVIKTTPATVVGDAVPDGTGATGPVYAGREDTAFAVLGLYHDVFATTVSVMTTTGAKTKALRKSWLDAIAASQAARNGAIKYIHTLKTPGTFPTVMRGLVALINDENKQLNGRLARNPFRGLTKKEMLRAVTRNKSTRKVVNRFWPPVPAG